VTPNGITSSTGLVVPFVRDSSGRITKITDPQGNNYLYSYDSSGNLASVTYPPTTQTTTLCPNTTLPNTSTYTYDSNHLYTSGTDALCHTLPSTAYYPSGTLDPNGLPLNGRVQSVTDSLGEITSYAYNLTTNTTSITYPLEANGNPGTATMVYDNLGNLLHSTDPLGLTTTNVYDQYSNLLSVTDPLGHTNSYTYDARGNKTSATYPQVTVGVNTTSAMAYNQYSEPTSTMDELGNVRTFNYDANYQPQSVTDTISGAPATLASFLFSANGTLQAGAIGYDITAQPARASQYTYDADGNMNSKTDALGRVTLYTYDSLGHKITMTAPLPTPSSSVAASTTTYTYDALGNLTQTAAPLGRTTGSTWDANGNKTSDTDADGNVTSYAYDPLNRLTTTTYPTQPATTNTNTYDFRNNLIDQTDQAGHVTHHAYDPSGRLTSVTQGYGTSAASTTSYRYYNDGRKQTETDALGHTTTYTYDAAGRLTAIAGPKGNFSYGYDAAGNRISSTDGNVTQFQYDARKRLTTTTYPDHTTVVNTYDGPGNLIGVRDQANNVVNYNYDAANQLQNVVQVNSPNAPQNTTAYGYDPLGNLASLSDANSHVTINGFDLLSELKTKALPYGSLTETRSYDPSGNLVSLQHFNGKTTTYTYDTLNRLITRAPDPTLGETTVTFTYTATGKRHTMTDASGTTTYGYDTDDRLISKATPAGTLNYTYDAAGNVASIASSNLNGASMSYTYDSLNRLSTVVDNRLPSGQNTTTYAYDPASNVATVKYPNGLQSTFTYDSLNRVTALSTPPVSSYSYTLGATGNRTNATEQNGRTLNWTYDGIYRLTNEAIASDPAGGNGSVGYVLDPVGNRTSDASTIPSISALTSSYNADDEILSAETYDANGNTLTTGGRTFAYDSENRLTSMNGGAVSVIYDGDGNRVVKTAGGVTTLYLVDDLNPTGYAQVVEEMSGAAVQREYTYGLQRISQNQLISGTWTESFYGYDGGGSVRQLTNLAGTVTDTYNYDAFGNLLNSTGSTPNNYLYRGEQYDPNLNLYYLRARYYNPATGRFLSRDPESGRPISPKTFHKYLYASGDPVNRVDPRGRGAMIEGVLLRAVVLGVVAAQYFVELDPNSQFIVVAAVACVGNRLKSAYDLIGYGLEGSGIDLYGHDDPSPSDTPIDTVCKDLSFAFPSL
jgi:RHS repeat-associated protein